MALSVEQIDHLDIQLGRKSHSRKWLKKQKNRKIRRFKQTEIPNIGYCGWEY